MTRATLIQHATRAALDAVTWRETCPALATLRQRDAIALWRMIQEMTP